MRRKSRKEATKRFLSILLTVLMLVGLMPPVSFAVGADVRIAATSGDVVTPLPLSLQDGEIWTDKSVKDLGDGAFEITLKAIGQDYEKTEQEEKEQLDVVLILDTSRSMKLNDKKEVIDPPNKLSKMKEAATAAVNQLLSVEGNQVAIVAYNERASVLQGFTGEDPEAIATKIDGLQAENGTNIQEALYKAEGLLKGRTRKAVVILMTDGYPTYYHTVQTDLKGSNRIGEGTYTGSNFVWNTILQALQLKQNTGADIYTIGFDIGTDPFANATLNPDASNTKPYRPEASPARYEGEKRDVTGEATVWYYRDKKDEGLYKKSIWSTEYTVNSQSPWSAFANLTADPKTNWVVGQEAPEYHYYGKYSGVHYFYRLAPATKVESQNVTKMKIAFNHTYQKQFVAVTEASDVNNLLEELTKIITTLISSKPQHYNLSDSERVYSDIVIEDVIGSQFVVDASTLDPSAQLVGGKVVWTIEGKDFDTMPAKSTAIDLAKVHQTTFKVVLKDSAGVGKHDTNDSAKAKFTMSPDNKLYNPSETMTEPWNMEQPLTNTGWVTLAKNTVQATVTVKQLVSGDEVSDDTREFSYTVYQGTTEIKSGTLTVNGEGHASVDIPVEITPSAIQNGGQVPFTVKVTHGDFGKYWTDKPAESEQTVYVTSEQLNPEAVYESSFAPKGLLTVKKAWEGEPAGFVKPAIDFEVLNAAKQKVATGQIPAGSEASQPIELPLGTYSVVETTKLPDFAPPAYTADVTFGGGVYTGEITIKNAYIEPTGTIEVFKAWNHEAADNPDYAAITQVDFHYEKTDDDTIKGTILVKKITDPEDETKTLWYGNVSGLPLGTYTITEEMPADYQETSPQTAVLTTADRLETLHFENVYVEPTGILTLTKKWVDDDHSALDLRNRPESVTLKVFKDGQEEPYQTVELTAADAVAGDGNTWQFILRDVPLGAYTITEVEDFEGYSESIPAEAVTLTKAQITGAFTVTNTLMAPHGEVTITKVWADNGQTDMRPETLTISLVPSEGDVLTHTFGTGENSESYTFNPLLGSEVTYTVMESTEGTGNEAKLGNYDAAYSNDNEAFAVTAEEDRHEITLTNALDEGTITVQKIWEKRNLDPDRKQQQALITLWKVETVTKLVPVEEEGDDAASDDADVDATIEVQYKEVTEEVITKVNAEPIAVTPRDPAVFYSMEIAENVSYYVTEAPIDFYDTLYRVMGVDKMRQDSCTPFSLTDEASNVTVRVINIYQDPKGELTVTKAWTPESLFGREKVTVNLYKVGEAVAVDSAIFSISHTFTGLDLGADYYVEEAEVTGFTPSYSSTPGSSSEMVFTPAKTQLKGTVAIENAVDQVYGSLTVTKDWKVMTGSAVTITLLARDGADGEWKPFRFSVPMDSVAALSTADSAPIISGLLLDEENGWTGTIEGLPKYGQFGYMTYRIQETGEDIELYTQELPGDVDFSETLERSVTVTNTYEPNRGSLTVEKVWKDADGEVTEAPEAIRNVTMDIYKNDDDTPMQTVILGYPAEGSSDMTPVWSTTLPNLDLTATYRVVEREVFEEYDTTVTPAAVSFEADGTQYSENELNQTVTVTNQANDPDVSLVIQKDIDKASKALINGQAVFQFTVTLTNTGNRTLKDVAVEDLLEQFSGDGYVTYNGAVSTLVLTDGKYVVGSLKPGEANSVTIPYSVTFTEDGDFMNTVVASGTYGDETVTSEPSDVEFRVKAPGLTITKEVVDPSVLNGSSGTFTYKLIVQNSGKEYLNDIKVTDVMNGPAGATITYGNVSGASFDDATKTFTIGSLAPAYENSPYEGQAKVEITYTVTVSRTGTYTNTATVTGIFEDYGDESEGFPVNTTLTDSDTASVTLRQPVIPTDEDEDDDDPTPQPNPNPGPTVVVDETDAPQGTPATVDVTETIAPMAPPATLPKTGELPSSIFFGMGGLLTGLGVLMRKRK